MKKTILCLAAAFMAMTSANAQTDTRLFNHLAIGLDVGTTGIGADVAMPCTKFVDIEAGFMIMPKITYSTNVHINTSEYIQNTGATKEIKTLAENLETIPIQGKLSMVNGKFMINFYPMPTKSLHLTVGAFFGKSDVVEVYNKIDGQLADINAANKAIDTYNDFAAKNPGYGWSTQEHIGLKLGDYLMEPDGNGNAKATLKTNNFKPYVGLGIGRAVPGRTRLNFKFDIGAMFWGAPDIVDHAGVSLTNKDFGDKDGGAIRVIKKIKVYPVLNFRLAGKIF